MSPTKEGADASRRGSRRILIVRNFENQSNVFSQPRLCKTLKTKVTCFGTCQKVSLVPANINNFKIQRKSTIPLTIASVRFFHFGPVEIFENLRSVFEFCTNTFLATAKNDHLSPVILMVFKTVKKRLYQWPFLNSDVSISYFAKHLVLEPIKKCHWSLLILTFF